MAQARRTKRNHRYRGGVSVRARKKPTRARRTRARSTSPQNIAAPLTPAAIRQMIAEDVADAEALLPPPRRSPRSPRRSPRSPRRSPSPRSPMPAHSLTRAQVRQELARWERVRARRLTRRSPIYRYPDVDSQERQRSLQDVVRGAGWYLRTQEQPDGTFLRMWIRRGSDPREVAVDRSFSPYGDVEAAFLVPRTRRRRRCCGFTVPYWDR